MAARMLRSIDLPQNTRLVGEVSRCHAWSPCGNRLAIGSWQSGVSIWDYHAGEWRLAHRGNVLRDPQPVDARTLLYHPSDEVSWSPDGKELVAAGLNNSAANIWAVPDIAPGSSSGDVQDMPHVCQMQFPLLVDNNNGQALPAALLGGMVYPLADNLANMPAHVLADVLPPQMLARVDTLSIGIAWSPAGGSIAYALGRIGGICIATRNGATWVPHAHILQCTDLMNAQVMLDWAPDGQRLAAWSGVVRGKVWIWRCKPSPGGTADGHQWVCEEILNFLTLTDDAYVLTSLAWSPDGQALTTMISGGRTRMRVWLLRTYHSVSAQLGQPLNAHFLWTHRDINMDDVFGHHAVAWAPNNPRLAATINAHGVLSLWAVDSTYTKWTLRQRLYDTLRFERHTRSLCWSPCGRRVSMRSGNAVAVWTLCSSWSDRTHRLFSFKTQQLVFYLMLVRHRLGAAEPGLLLLPMEMWLEIFACIAMCIK